MAAPPHVHPGAGARRAGDRRPARGARAHPLRGGARAAARARRGASQQLLFPALVDLSREAVRAAARAGAVAAAAGLGPLAARAADRGDPGRAVRTSSGAARARCSRTCSTGSDEDSGAAAEQDDLPSTSRARTPATPRSAPAIRSTPRGDAQRWSTGCSRPRARTAIRTAAPRSCGSTSTSCTGASAAAERTRRATRTPSSRWSAPPPPARPRSAERVAAASSAARSCARTRARCSASSRSAPASRRRPSARRATRTTCSTRSTLGEPVERARAGWYARAAREVCDGDPSRAARARCWSAARGSTWARCAQRSRADAAAAIPRCARASRGSWRPHGPAGAARAARASVIPRPRARLAPRDPQRVLARARGAGGQRPAALVVARAAARARPSRRSGRTFELVIEPGALRRAHRAAHARDVRAGPDRGDARARGSAGWGQRCERLRAIGYDEALDLTRGPARSRRGRANAPGCAPPARQAPAHLVPPPARRRAAGRRRDPASSPEQRAHVRCSAAAARDAAAPGIDSARRLHPLAFSSRRLL